MYYRRPPMNGLTGRWYSQPLRLLIAVEGVVCSTIKGDGSVLRNLNTARGAIALDGRDKPFPSSASFTSVPFR